MNESRHKHYYYDIIFDRQTVRRLKEIAEELSDELAKTEIIEY